MGGRTAKTNSKLNTTLKITEFGKSKFHFATGKLPKQQRLFLNQFVKNLRAGDFETLKGLLIKHPEFKTIKFPYQGRQMTPRQIIDYEKKQQG